MDSEFSLRLPTATALYRKCRRCKWMRTWVVSHDPRRTTWFNLLRYSIYTAPLDAQRHHTLKYYIKLKVICSFHILSATSWRQMAAKTACLMCSMVWVGVAQLRRGDQSSWLDLRGQTCFPPRGRSGWERLVPAHPLEKSEGRRRRRRKRHRR